MSMKLLAMVSALPILFVSACGSSYGSSSSYRTAQMTSASTFVFPLAGSALVVPFPVQNACSANEIFQNINAGIVVESVLADDKEITPERSTGFAVNDPMPVTNTPGFIYLSRGHLLYSFADAVVGNNLPIVLRFAIPADDEFVKAKAIEVRYRVRCPSGAVSGPMIVRGRREDVTRD